MMLPFSSASLSPILNAIAVFILKSYCQCHHHSLQSFIAITHHLHFSSSLAILQCKLSPHPFTIIIKHYHLPSFSLLISHHHHSPSSTAFIHHHPPHSFTTIIYLHHSLSSFIIIHHYPSPSFTIIVHRRHLLAMPYFVLFSDIFE